MSVAKNVVSVSVMQRSGESFKWPNHKDEINYHMEPVMAKIEPPTVAGNQEQLTFGYFNTQ